MSKIRVLSDHTINKIAAGEVIENPASVIKELVENSIDAQSSDITIEITGGGRQLIRITDNGCGMSEDDALLCLERHATSKIHDVEDILDIQSMGFRGEAIPSIASISKFTLITSPRHQEGDSFNSNCKGTMIIVDGGKVMTVAEAARSPGTTIEVKQLFFNVPVRRKFQKSPQYDSAEITRVLTSLALGHPDIQFTLINNHKTIFSTHATENGDRSSALLERVRDLLGSEYANNCCLVNAQQDGFEIHGLIGLPTYTRHNRTGQHLFINLRAVVSPLFSYHVKEGYGTALANGRHPVFVLHVKVPSGSVDVNVHPQKREVRIRGEEKLKSLVLKAIDSALQNAGIAYSTMYASNSIDYSYNSNEKYPWETTNNEKNIFSEDNKEHSHTLQPSYFSQSQAIDDFSWKDFNAKEMDSYCSSSSDIKANIENVNYSESFITTPSKSYENQNERLQERQQEQRLSLVSTKTTITPNILFFIKGYIFIESQSMQGIFPGNFDNEGVFVIHQKGAHARVIFDRLKDGQLHRELQNYLIPPTVELDLADASLLIGYQAKLATMGIHIRAIGPSSIAIDALPSVISSSKMDSLINTLLEELRGQGEYGLDREQDRFFAATSHKIAITCQQRLTHPEALKLVEQLIQSNQPFRCPLGKSIIAWLGTEELSKLF